MHAPNRPVPSFSALKALRQLAYIASGTACGAAALVYEERRRQIHLLKQVAENGKLLSNVARQRRRRHEQAGGNAKQETASVRAAAAADAAMVYAPHLSLAGHTGEDSTLDGSVPRDGIRLNSTSFRDDTLPSQVDQGYCKWIRRQNTLELLQERETPQSGHRRRASEHGIRFRQHTLFKRMIQWPGTAQLISDRYSSRSFSSSRCFRQDTQRTAYLHAQMGDIDVAIDHWQSKLSGTLDDGKAVGRSLATLTQAMSGHDAACLIAFAEEPYSTEALLSTAVHLRLPDLVLAVSRHAIRSDQMDILLPRIVRWLLEQSDPQIFRDARQELLEWSITAPASLSSRTLSLAKLRWCQLSLLLSSAPLAETGKLYSRLKHSLQLDPNRSPRLSQVILQNISALEPAPSAIQGGLADMVETLVNAGRPHAAAQILQDCAEFDTAIIEPILGSLSSDVDVQQLNELATILRSQGMEHRPVVKQLWRRATSDMNLLDLYEDFGLDPLPERRVLSRLFHAKMKHCSSHSLGSDLLGRSSRIWTGVLARDWEKCDDPRRVYRQFSEVQKSLGSRQLQPELYHVVIRKCRKHNMDIEAHKISQLREGLFRSSKLFTITSELIRLSRVSKWEAISQQLRSLHPRDFGAMQMQQRAQIFDPIIRSYATAERSASELFNMALSIYNRVYDYTSPSQALRLLAMSLIRNGQVSALMKVHRESEKLLGQRLNLTPVDTIDFLRSFYYSYRPSHIGLATVMQKTFQEAWQSVSRLCLPLLLVSASYDGRRAEQKRSATEAADLVRSALLEIDEPEVRDALMLESRLAGSGNGYRSLHFTKDEWARQSRAAPTTPISADVQMIAPSKNAEPSWASSSVPKRTPYGMIDSALLPAFFQLSLRGTEVRQSAALATTDIDEQEALISALPTFQSSDMSAIPPSAWKPIEGPGSADRGKVGQDPTCHPFGSMEGHFAHNLTKALLHSSDGKKGGEDAASLVRQLEQRNALAPSASIASLATKSSQGGLSSLRQIFELAGTDATLSDSREAIDSIAEASLNTRQLEAPETMQKLKDLITAEYGKLERGGHAISHALATAVAQLMLRHDRPACAVELIRHALKSPWGSIIRPGIATMLMLLKAYIALGRTDGVRWVVGHVMARGERMEKSFLTAFKVGRQLWESAEHGRLDARARAALVVELGRLQRICIEYQGRQVAAAWKVGNELAAYIGEYAAPAKAVEWSAEDEFATRGKMAKADGDTERFRDAVYVQSICADVLTMARRRRGTISKSAKGNGMDLRFVRAMKRVEGRRRRRPLAQS